MAQEATALRYPEAEGVRDGPAVGQDRVAVGLETQERDEVTQAGEADAEHRRLGRLIPQLINPERLEFASFRQQADRAPVDEFPFAAWDLGTRLAFAIAYHQPSFRLMERGYGVREAVGAAVARAARADVELVTYEAGDGVAVLHRCRKISSEAAIDARRTWIPAGPDERVTAAEQKAEAGVFLGLRVVIAGRIGRHDIVEQREDPLRAAVRHVVDQDAAAASHVLRPQHVDVGSIFDEPCGVARRLVEIDDAGVLGGIGIEDATRDTADPEIGPDCAEFVAAGEIGDVGNGDCGYRHGGFPSGRLTFSRSSWDSGSAKKASSSGVDVRPSTAFRCGNRPKRSMI